MADLIDQIELLKSSGCVRVLIVRQSSVGDVVCTLPLLKYLRSIFPNAKIAWFAESGPASLLASHRLLDDVILAPKRWEETPKLIAQVRDELLAFGPDITIDSQGLPKTGYAAWLSSAPIRVGFRGSAAQGWNESFNNYHVLAKGVHFVHQNLSLLSAISDTLIDFSDTVSLFDMPLNQSVHDQMLAALKLCGLEKKSFYLVNVGCSIPARRWSPDCFVEVIRRMGETERAPAVLCWGNEDEKECAVDVLQRAGRWAFLAPRTNLLEAMELSRQAVLFLSNDTGPMHIAAAVGTPCVSLHGPTWGERSGPFGPNHHRIQSPILLNVQEDLNPFDTTRIDAIGVESVFDACSAAWKLDRRGPI